MGKQQLVVAGIAALVLAAPAAASADTYTWITDGGGAWEDGANWLEGAPPGPTDGARFPQLSPTGSLHALRITVTGDVAVGGIVQDAARTSAVTITGGRLLVAEGGSIVSGRSGLRIESALDLAGVTSVAAQGLDARIDLLGPIGGAGGLAVTTLDPGSAVWLGTANSYAGGTTVFGGRRDNSSFFGLVALVDGALSTGPITLFGTLRLGAQTVANPIACGTGGGGAVVARIHGGGALLTGRITGVALGLGLEDLTVGSFVTLAGAVEVARIETWGSSLTIAASADVGDPVTLVPGTGSQTFVRAVAPGLRVAHDATSGARPLTFADGARLGEIGAGAWTLVVDAGATARVERLVGATAVATRGGTLRVDTLDAPSGNLTVDGTLEVGAGTVRSIAIGGTVRGTLTAATIATAVVSLGDPSVLAPGLPLGEVSATTLRLQVPTTLAIDLLGTASDRLVLGGALADYSLGGTALAVTALGAIDPRATFVIVDNQRPATEHVLGTFAGLPEGAPVVVGDATFTITYVGGDGNDIALLGTVTCNEGDTDGDGQPDDCDADDDGDGVADAADGCPRVYDPDQLDADGDLAGDACDEDDDGDGVRDGDDTCPYVAAPQDDRDGDGLGDACDLDADGDGVPDAIDVCPGEPDAAQLDLDGDGAGDACDPDDDGDGVLDDLDACPTVFELAQVDLDGDGLGDACDADDDGDGVDDATDVCPEVSDGGQLDTDADGAGDACDADDDDDGFADAVDSCPLVANLFQLDLDLDGRGDACDPDDDGDGVLDDADLCPTVADVDQLDTDGDGAGDACDADDDDDGVADAADSCPFTANPYQLDADLDGRGDACDDDDDGDGVADEADACPAVPDPAQGDLDGDGVGDACDDDDDGDGVVDLADRCPRLADADQLDTDADGAGDACDADDDDDGVADGVDLCPRMADPAQADLDHDGLGDACDADADDDGVPSAADGCPHTPAGAVIDPGSGCSLAELCPCTGPRGASTPWRNRGAFASCVAHTAQAFRAGGLLSAPGERDAVAATIAACR